MEAVPAPKETACRLDVDIVVEDERWSALDGPDGHGRLEALVTRAAHEAYRGAGETRAATVAVALLDDAAVANLNRQFRGKDKPTNVLSFPAEETAHGEDDVQGHPLGDIALAYDTIQAEAREMAMPVDHHVTHLVVHGVLHLLGFDHENDVEAEEMETLETRILAEMGIADPYAAD